ncbi:MAG: transcriptional repressor LexA [bacterium]|jgi:repressor LexA
MERKRAIYEFIRDEITSGGRPPTIREIGARFNISSTNGVRYFLNKLEEDGLISRIANTSRGISLSLHEREGEARRIPVLGRVPAGGPSFGEENYEGSILVDERLVRGKDVFAVKVHGDSMIGAGINDGDIAIVRRNPDPPSGEIVIALIDDEVTLKRLVKKGNRVILKPENKRYRDIMLSGADGRRVAVLGTLEAIVRKY